MVKKFLFNRIKINKLFFIIPAIIALLLLSLLPEITITIFLKHYEPPQGETGYYEGALLGIFIMLVVIGIIMFSLPIAIVAVVGVILCVAYIIALIKKTDLWIMEMKGIFVVLIYMLLILLIGGGITLLIKL